MIMYNNMLFDSKNTMLLYKAIEDKVPHINSDGILTHDDVMAVWNQVFKGKYVPIPVYRMK